MLIYLEDSNNDNDDGIFCKVSVIYVLNNLCKILQVKVWGIIFLEIMFGLFICQNGNKVILSVYFYSIGQFCIIIYFGFICVLDFFSMFMLVFLRKQIRFEKIIN